MSAVSAAGAASGSEVEEPVAGVPPSGIVASRELEAERTAALAAAIPNTTSTSTTAAAAPIRTRRVTAGA
jgi:hypothetical protein